MFCNKCGTNLKENSVFCPNCGERIQNTNENAGYYEQMNGMQSGGNYGAKISADFRAEARRRLSGKWGKVAGITLIFTILLTLIQYIPIIAILINIPLSFGYGFVLYKIFRNQEVGYFDFFSLGFNNFGKAWKIRLNILLKLLLPIVCMIVGIIIMGLGTSFSGANVVLNNAEKVQALFVNNSGNIGGLIMVIIGFFIFFGAMIYVTIKSFLYVIAEFIAYENPGMYASDAVEASAKLMRGNRGKYFILTLTFIGWAILGMFTMFIGYLWLLPYLTLSYFAFAEYLVSSNSIKTKENSYV